MSTKQETLDDLRNYRVITMSRLFKNPNAKSAFLEENPEKKKNLVEMYNSPDCKTENSTAPLNTKKLKERDILNVLI